MAQISEARKMNIQSSFEQLFEGHKKILETEADYFSTLTKHPGEKGC